MEELDFVVEQSNRLLRHPAYDAISSVPDLGLVFVSLDFEQLSVLFLVMLQQLEQLAEVKADFGVFLSELVLERDVEDESIDSVLLDDVHEFVIEEYSFIQRVETELLVD